MFNIFNKFYIKILIKLGLKKKESVAVSGNFDGLKMTRNKFIGYDKMLETKNSKNVELEDNEAFR